MEKTVLRQIDELSRMSMIQLRKRWADLMGTDPGKLGRQYLMRRLAYRVQELAYGGLSPQARRQLAPEHGSTRRRDRPPSGQRNAAPAGGATTRRLNGDNTTSRVTVWRGRWKLRSVMPD